MIAAHRTLAYPRRRDDDYSLRVRQSIPLIEFDVVRRAFRAQSRRAVGWTVGRGPLDDSAMLDDSATSFHVTRLFAYGAVGKETTAYTVAQHLARRAPHRAD